MASCITAQERARRFSIGLIVAHLILALAAVLLFTSGFSDYAWPRWQSIFLEALAFAQVGLVTAILAIGSLSITYRVAAAATVFMFWMIVLGALDLYHENWLSIFAIQTIGIGVCLSVARIFGTRLTYEPVMDDGSLERTRLRFSMRQILLVTAGVSFLLGAATVVGKLPDFHESLDRGVLLRAKILGVGLVLIVLAAVWAAFTTGRRTTPFLLLIVVTLLAAYAIASADRMFRTAWWSTLTRESYQMAYLYLVFLYALIAYVSLTILRAGGLRIRHKS